MRTDPSTWTVLVTGGSSGLGAAVVEQLRSLGATPVVLDRKPPQADVAFHEVDLASSADAARAVGEAIAEHGEVDAVVTCAGIDHPGRLDEVSQDTWDHVTAVNLIGTAAVVRAALPCLRQTHGRVVVVASTLGHQGVSDATAYCASKFAVVGFARALMAEVREEVGVTLFTPGGMTTAFFDDRDEQYKPPPDARLADPAAIAGGIVFALTRPEGVEVKEMVMTAPSESTWP